MHISGNNIKQFAHLHYYFNGGGEMGKLIREFDWSKTVLGSPESWSPSLLTTVNIILNSRVPMFLMWGPQLIQFYNDAYRPCLLKNSKHPKALGQRADDCCSDVSMITKPLLDQLLSGSIANWSQDQYLPIYRNGKAEDVYWTFNYSSVNDESGTPAGIMVICNETTDIVAKLKAQEDLKYADERYQILFTSSPLPKLIYDLETLAILDANNAATVRYGYSREEFLSMNARDLRAEEEIPQLLAAQQLMRSSFGTVYPGIFTHQKKDKTKLQLSISSTRLFFKDTNCIMVVGEDLTENHYYQQLDKLESNILEININEINDLRFMLNTYITGIEKLHPGMICSIQEVRGNRLFNMASPSLPQGYLERIEGVETGLNKGSCGTAAFTKQKVVVTDIANDIRWHNYKELAAQYHLQACWSTPLLDADNNVIATFANYFYEPRNPSDIEENTVNRASRILRVILESFRREQSLKVVKEKYFYATEATSDAIWDWDLVGETIEWGQGYKTIFGYDEGTVKEVKQSIVSHIHPEDIDRVLNSLSEAIANKKNTWTAEYRYMKSNQSYAFVTDKGIIIRDNDGKATRIVGAMQDITRQKQEEQMLLLLNEKLREISWMQSHIIRAPLTRIMGLIHLLKDTNMEFSDKEKTLEYILLSANELDVVINNITQMSNSG